MADDLARYLRSQGWDWRSDMNAPLPGAPELRAAAPRDVTDNVRPMAYDALSAMGASHPTAQLYAQKLGEAAPWTPPGIAANAAGVIGGKLHEGKPLDALMSAYLLYGAGKLGQAAGNAFLPPITDKAKAVAKEAMYPKERSAAEPWSREGELLGLKAQIQQLKQDVKTMESLNRRQPGLDAPAANINDRRNFNRALEVVPKD